MDDSGLTYSLEAMLGILLIAGVVVFVTGNPPPIAEPSGKYSKIQLVNLGEDILSLLASAPFKDTGVNETALYNNVSRNYTLVADKTHAGINENVSFKIYYLGNKTLVNENLTYYWYPGGSNTTSNGTFNLSFGEEREYQVQVKNAKLSNNVSIYVGDYLLLLNVYGIGFNDTIRGTVTKEGAGVGNLTINIYDDNKNLKNNTNQTQEGGRFSLKWAWSQGKFYINASNETSTSNLQELNVTDGSVVLSIDKNHIFETRNVTFNLTSGSGSSCSNFTANDKILVDSSILCTNIGGEQYNLTFKRAGDYIIQFKNGSTQSNPVLVTVHTMESYLASPLSYFLGTNILFPYGTEYKYLRLWDLENLVRPFIPAHMDYNLYLYRVSPEGSLVEEDSIFHGVPSHDAVVISRLVRTEAVDGTGVPRELRIVLWYR